MLANHCVPKFQRSFRLTEIREECDWLRLGKFYRHQSTRAYFEGRAYIKSILKNYARSYYPGNTVIHLSIILIIY